MLLELNSLDASEGTSYLFMAISRLIFLNESLWFPQQQSAAASETNTATFQMIHHFNCLKYDISMAIIMVIKHNVYTIPVSITAGFCHLGAAAAKTLQ